MNHSLDSDRLFSPQERDSFPLIHLTQDWKILQLILTEGFKPSYCRENLTNEQETKEACFPMISTSNVEVNYAITYQKSYGTFGIILSKRWGAENDFNPVLYFERKSDLTDEIIKNFNKIAALSTEDLVNALSGYTTDYKSLMTKQHIKIFVHSKNYDGVLKRKYIDEIANYPYGIEREWRKIIRHEKIPYFLINDDIQKKNDFNKILSDIRVDYSIEHLQGVIVENEYQEENVKKIILEKFNIKEFPKHIEIIINTTRRIPDEG